MDISGLAVTRPLLLLGICLTGCSSTELVNSWVKPEGVAQPFRKVVVAALLERDDLRRTMEDDLVAQIKARGADAVPGYSLFPAGTTDRELVKRTVEQTGADAVLVSGLVKIEKVTDVSPGYVSGPPVYRGGYYGYYSTGWQTYYQPPTIYQYDVATLDTKLFDVKGNDLVWTATTRTVDLSNPKAEIANLARIITNDLSKKKLIP